MTNRDGFEPGQRVDFEEISRAERRKTSERKQQPRGQEPGEIDMTGLTATHRGAGRYRVTNAQGETVAESVSKAEAQEMGAEA